MSRVRSYRRSVLVYGIAVLFLVTMCFNRIYLGYHWPTDTLASISLALVELGTVIAIDTWRTVETPVRQAPAETRGSESRPVEGSPPTHR